MHIEIGYVGMERSDAIDEQVHSALETSLGRFGERLTRVEVHLEDENAQKEGPRDKRCLMEARPAGKQPIVAEHHGDDVRDVVRETARKLERAIESRLRN